MCGDTSRGVVSVTVAFPLFEIDLAPAYISQHLLEELARFWRHAVVLPGVEFRFLIATVTSRVAMF